MASLLRYVNYTRGTQVLQGDVILCGFPYSSFEMSDAVRKNDLEAYAAPVTDPGGPAMTWPMFAIGWLQLGNYTAARENFLHGYDPNIQPPFAVWLEEPGGGTVHFITGAGGFLQSVVFGYGGIRLQEDRLTLRVPPLPAGSTSLVLRGLHYQGNKLSITITAGKVTVEVAERDEGAAALVLCTADGTLRKLTVGAQLRFSRDAAASIRFSDNCGP
jgi:protein-glucosylgalactosylhydroxylysine glucosidase